MFCVLIYLWFAKMMMIWKHVAGIVTDPKEKQKKVDKMAKQNKTKKKSESYVPELKEAPDYV